IVVGLWFAFAEAIVDGARIRHRGLVHGRYRPRKTGVRHMAEGAGHILEHGEIFIVVLELAENLDGFHAVICEDLVRAGGHEWAQAGPVCHSLLLDSANLTPYAL